jgi:3-isopropylmalate dehydrogenase
MKKIAILPGDGIGVEITKPAVNILNFLNDKYSLGFEIEYSDIGGVGYDNFKDPLPYQTLKLAQQADSVILGAVGGYEYDKLPRDKRPEQGLLRIRSGLDLFANLRPAISYEKLSHSSSLKQELIKDLDIMIVRELTSGIYFGKPRGIRVNENGIKEGYNTLIYNENEIRRIAKVAFNIAKKRNKYLCSVDKANVLESSQLWREIVIDVAKDYQYVKLEHMYVDNAAMQLIKNPKQFDVILTGNMFGDILSDTAAQLTGSIGMLPSASLDSNNKGMYEPIHGSAPDIAGKDIANPIAMILSVAMMLKYSFNLPKQSKEIQKAVQRVLDKNIATVDIQSKNSKTVSCSQMGNFILQELKTCIVA